MKYQIPAAAPRSRSTIGQRNLLREIRGKGATSKGGHARVGKRPLRKEQFAVLLESQWIEPNGIDGDTFRWTISDKGAWMLSIYQD